MGQMCLNNGAPLGDTGVTRHRYPPWGDGSHATSHTMPHRGVSCHLLYAVVPSFFKNLLQKGAGGGGRWARGSLTTWPHTVLSLLWPRRGFMSRGRLAWGSTTHANITGWRSER